jgi:hypothetical protein
MVSANTPFGGSSWFFSVIPPSHPAFLLSAFLLAKIKRVLYKQAVPNTDFLKGSCLKTGGLPVQPGAAKAYEALRKHCAMAEAHFGVQGASP